MSRDAEDAEDELKAELRGADDWPDASRVVRFHGALARRSRALRDWVAASPCRALSADGMTLFVARRHGMYRHGRGELQIWSDPPDPGGDGMFVVDVFHANADATGYFQSQKIAPEVEVLRLAWDKDALHAVLRLPDAQRVELELHDATVEVAWPLGGDGGLAREVSPLDSTERGYVLHLAELLVRGGVACGQLALEAEARRRERDDREDRRSAAHRAVRERTGAALERSWRVSDLGAQQERGLDEAVARAGLGAHRGVLRRVARPCWSLAPGPGPRRSRVGGVPDLPRGTAWPALEGDLLHFIAQIDLAELQPLTGVELPRQGLISLFTGMLEPANDVEHVVVFTPGGIEAVATRPPGRNFRDEYLQIAGSLPLVAEPAVALPEYGSDVYEHFVADACADAGHDRYFALQGALLGDRSEGVSTVLGYPDDGGARPEATAWFRRAGRPDCRYWLREELDTDDKRAQFDDVHERRDEIVAGFLDWVPLLRLCSYAKIGAMFWDAGTLDVMIHRADLAALRFDRTVAIVASA